MIPVTKPFLPSINKYKKYLDGIYSRQYLTNNGPLYQELTKRLEEYLGVTNLLLVCNGTVALQMSLRALQIPQSSQVITTPFSFAATTGALMWEGYTPQFCDVREDNFNINTEYLHVNACTTAIMPVHVFGCPADVIDLQNIAESHNLKLIYDAAHAFGIKFRQQSILNYGDAATLSFHATKLFHSVEGGAVIFKDSDAYEAAKQMINFGLNECGEAVSVGINGKLSEFHSAMGLAVLDEIETICQNRKNQVDQYVKCLEGVLRLQTWPDDVTNNGAYMPVVFESEEELLGALSVLNRNQIFPRRYFYPSLNTCGAFRNGQDCAMSESIASRILCLPLYFDLTEDDIANICRLILQSFK